LGHRSLQLHSSQFENLFSIGHNTVNTIEDNYLIIFVEQRREEKEKK
jgi:hypothetical protein